MRSILPVLVLLAISSHAWAQGVNTSIIKQRAREVTGAQQKPLPTAQPAPTANSGQNAASSINQAVVSKLAANIAVIKIRPEASGEHKQKLAKDLALAAQTGAPASSDALTKLANDLATAVAGTKFTAQDQTLLARNLTGLLGGKNLSSQVIESVLVSTKDVLLKAGAKPDFTQVVIQDLVAMVGGTQKTSAK